MKHAVRLLATGSAIAMAMTASAVAADLAVPEIIETPVYEAPERVVHKMSGWYIRGDVGYAFTNTYEGALYATPGGTNTLSGDLDASYSIGGGVGYQINSYLRTDLTVDYDFGSDFTGSTTGPCGGALAPATCISTDTSSYTAWTVLANAYVELGTYVGITPYIGAGIGGAYVHWDDLSNTECVSTAPATCNPTVVHGGSSDWRFAYAVMAGLSYHVSKKLTVDLGYRYKRIRGGHQFGFANNVGPGYDEGFTSHEVRAGLRYKFGGKHYKKHQVAYHPTPVYK